jgi:hypothetical protein
MSFKHYIITRFNNVCPKDLIKNNSEYIVTDDWMTHRFVLFSNFTIPSIKKQSGDFTWILRFHPQTDKKWLNQCEDLCKDIKIIIHNSEKSWTNLIDKKVDYVITSRLDNDDILGPNYVEKIHKSFRGEREMILWENGLNISKEGEYIVNQLSNPFLALIEKTDNFVGCFNKVHLDMIKYEPYTVLEGMEWCQVVHRYNVSNKIRKHYIKTQNTWAEPHQQLLKTLDV